MVFFFAFVYAHLTQMKRLHLEATKCDANQMSTKMCASNHYMYLYILQQVGTYNPIPDKMGIKELRLNMGEFVEKRLLAGIVEQRSLFVCTALGNIHTIH